MQHTVSRPHERPEVKVLVDGAWHYGELRMWTQHADRTWSAQVTWTRAAGENLIGKFPASEIRPVRPRTVTE
jgi:hypothetical protein